LPYSSFVIWFLALCAFFAWYAAIELRRHPLPIGQIVAIYSCLSILLALYLAPGFFVLRKWLTDRVKGFRGGLVCVGLFLFPYLVYAAGTGDFRPGALLRLLALVGLPIGLFSVTQIRHPRRMNWQDVLILLWIVVPVLTGQIGGIWNVPVNLDFMVRLFLVGAGSWSFLIFRGVENAGYEFHFSWQTLRSSLMNLGGFTAIGLPLGLALPFVGWHPQWRGFGSFAADFLGVFLFIAVAEELFFRGLLQNLLEGSLHSRYGAQAIAAILFGLSHIRHAPYPNWRYVALATVAGWFYGSAWRSHHSLMASATTHALVDTLWRTFLTLPRG
jgi:membrane protease YdiL (CAAX protease family)